jgi:hypothetical protein
MLVGLLALFSGCGGSGGGSDAPLESLTPPAERTVVGRMVEVQAVPAVRAITDPGTTSYVILNDESVEWPLDEQGRFELTEVLDGDHSLFIYNTSGVVIEVPFRMLSGRGLNLGMVTIRNGQLDQVTGFDGYRFGFVDQDGDGINDLCCDRDGNGVCDQGSHYAHYTYLMNWGYVDDDGDGRNDRYWDGNGDGRNDLDDIPNGWGFGFVDENQDGINDRFRDSDGNGICDQTGMPYRVGYNWTDADGDGVNDEFVDSDGDGVNDVDGQPFVSLPGWVDLDGDGVNDRFRDADGDGICDLCGMAYAHGFGWVDDDGDGINDHFQDGNGDAVNDVQEGPYARFHYRHGFLGPHVDLDGDGVADGVGINLRDGFGWVDADEDSINDAFVDENGDGINDYTGCHYDCGYIQETGWQHRSHPVTWPHCDDAKGR